MILYHPLKRPQNKIAIEKYASRKVFVKSKAGWLTDMLFWSTDERSMCLFSFKDALKATKKYQSDCGIEYHFLDEFGLKKPEIQDFDEESIHLCNTIRFESEGNKSIR